jgi:hypothetical protein
LTVGIIDISLEKLFDSAGAAIRGWPKHYDSSSDPLYLKRMNLRPWAAQRDAISEYIGNAVALNVYLTSLAQETCNPNPPRVPLDGLD